MWSGGASTISDKTPGRGGKDETKNLVQSLKNYGPRSPSGGKNIQTGARHSLIPDVGQLRARQVALTIALKKRNFRLTYWRRRFPIISENLMIH